jgi:hypothetical protein
LLAWISRWVSEPSSDSQWSQWSGTAFVVSREMGRQRGADRISNGRKGRMPVISNAPLYCGIMRRQGANVGYQV